MLPELLLAVSPTIRLFVPKARVPPVTVKLFLAVMATPALMVLLPFMVRL